MSNTALPLTLLAGYLTEAEMAAQLGKSTRTLKRWRAAGKGPPYTLNGRSVIYNIASGKAYLKDGEITPRLSRPARKLARNSIAAVQEAL